MLRLVQGKLDRNWVFVNRHVTLESRLSIKTGFMNKRELFNAPPCLLKLGSSLKRPFLYPLQNAIKKN